MSDVSGIPYMGPMGQGNFFAPTFSYNPQMSAGQISSNYMPEIYNNQNVVNNLFNTGGGMGGFGKATDYYSALGAQYLAQVPSSWENPYTHGAIVPQSLRVEGGNYADGIGYGGISYQGGGYGGDQFAMDNVFRQLNGGGLGGSQPSYGGPTIDWSGVGNAAAGLGGGGATNFNFDNGMFGGLGGGVGAYQGPNNQIDWTHLFERGVGGGAQADPYSGMSMPGGLNAPMSLPQQQPVDYGSLFGQGVGGTGGAPSASYQPPAPAPMPSAGEYGAGMFGGLAGGIGGAYQGPGNTFGERFDALGGSEPMGGDAPAPAAPAPAAPDGTRTYDFAPMFEAGGGGGFGSGGGDVSGTGDVAAPSLGGNAFSYNPYQSGSQDTSGPSADALAEQARARLAGIMGSGDVAPVAPSEGTGRTAESAREAGGPVTSDAATGRIPLPQARPAGADVPRPPADIPPATSAIEPPAAPAYDQNKRLDEIERYFQGLPRSPNQVQDPFALPFGDPNAPRPPESVPAFPAARLAPNGKAPEAFVVHHTGSGPNATPESIVADWRANRPGVGVQYIMDRNGIVHDVAAEYGYTATGQALPRATGIYPGSQGLNNANLVGMEIMAKNEKDVLPVQLNNLQRFAAERFPDTPFYGHGEISTNKEANEGQRGAQLILQSRPQTFPSSPDFWDQLKTPGAGASAVPPGAAGAIAPDGTGTVSPNYWNVPKPGTPEWQNEVYEPNQGGFIMRRNESGTGGRWQDFARTGNIEDRRGEYLTPEQRAALPPVGYQALPEVAPTPLSGALGLGDLPVPRAGTAAGTVRPQGITGDDGRDTLASVIGPTSSAFGFDPGGFGEGGYGNAFAPTQTLGQLPDMQQGPTMPSWQANIPPAYRTPEVTAAVEAEARRLGVPPEAIVGVAQVEGSKWNPQYMTGQQAGIFQIAPDDFRTAGGTLGGLTYDQYRNATPAQQVAAYGDYIRSSPNAAYLDAASGDPALAGALLQGIQFSPQSDAFSKEFLAGNQDFQIAHDDKGRAPFYTGQADELRYTTIDDMRGAFARMIAGFPQTQTLPGGR